MYVPLLLYWRGGRGMVWFLIGLLVGAGLGFGFAALIIIGDDD